MATPLPLEVDLHKKETIQLLKDYELRCRASSIFAYLETIIEIIYMYIMTRKFEPFSGLHILSQV